MNELPGMGIFQGIQQLTDKPNRAPDRWFEEASVEDKRAALFLVCSKLTFKDGCVSAEFRYIRVESGSRK